MANTTFSGPVRSENGFRVITKNATTGAITDGVLVGTSGVVYPPVALGDSAHALTLADHAGRVMAVANVSGDRIITLPTTFVAGTSFTFISDSGVTDDGHDVIISSGSNTRFFLGSVVHLDTNADNLTVVPNRSSNSKLQLNVPGFFEINVLAKDATNWYIWGSVCSATVPAFADQ